MNSAERAMKKSTSVRSAQTAGSGKQVSAGRLPTLLELQALIGNRAVTGLLADASSSSGASMAIQRIQDLATWLGGQPVTYALLEQYFGLVLRPAWAQVRATLTNKAPYAYVDQAFNIAALEVRKMRNNLAAVQDFAANSLPTLVETIEGAIDAISQEQAGVADKQARTAAAEEAQQAQQAPRFEYEDSTEGGTMHKMPKTYSEEVDTLIGLFRVVEVSPAEASKTQDYIVTLRGDTRKRIDRQGPAFGGTYARFAVQFGKETYAGIHMPVNIAFPLDVVQAAFRASLQSQKYQKLTYA